MEQTKNIARASELLSPALIAETEQQLAALTSAPAAGTPASRSDGWTPDRIRAFLNALSQCGVVADAARAAGMSKQSAYAFRNSARGRGFNVAWHAALLLVRRRLADVVMSRALNGCVEVIVRDGEVWGERHRFDNRLTMAVLSRLDSYAEDYRHQSHVPRRVGEEFDAFVEAVCAGGDAAAEFINDRAEMHGSAWEEANIVDRNETYAQLGFEAVSALADTYRRRWED